MENNDLIGGQTPEMLPMTTENANISQEDLKKLFNDSVNFLITMRLDEARKGFLKILEYNPKSAEGHLNLGNTYFKMGNIDESIKLFRKSIDLDPVLVNAYLNIGNAYFKKDRVDDAIGYWNIACNINPRLGTAHRNIAVAYEKIKKPQKAFKHYETYLECVKKPNKIYHQIHQKVHEAKKAAYFNFNIGLKLEKRNKIADAVNAYKKSIEIYPNYSKAALNLGNLLYREKYVDHAIHFWKMASFLDPEHSNTHCNLAVAYDKKKEYDMALYHFLKYIEFSSEAGDEKNVLKRIEQFKAFFADKKAVLKKHVTNGDAYFSRGLYEEAINAYMIYMTIAPEASDIQAVMQKLEEAQTRLNPVQKASQVALELGDQYFADSKFDKALMAYNRYIALNPYASDISKVRRKAEECNKRIAKVLSAMLESR